MSPIAEREARTLAALAVAGPGVLALPRQAGELICARPFKGDRGAHDASETGNARTERRAPHIAPLFILVGIMHLTRANSIAPLMPSVVAYPVAVILLTGVAEMAGAIASFIPRTRALAGIMLALYAVCVFPVNVDQAVHDLSTSTGLGWAYHYPRLFVQPLICWWALVAGKVTWAPKFGSAR